MASVEKFAEKLPLNLEEIFIWYFEQKGVDNPERFLNIQEQQPETNQNLNALLPMIGMLVEQQKKAGVGINERVKSENTEPPKEPNEFEEFVNNLEELSKQEV